MKYLPMREDLPRDKKTVENQDWAVRGPWAAEPRACF